MSRSRWQFIKGKKGPDIHTVNEETKNAVIAKAVKVWQTINLTDDKIAFGIATMGVESGFDHTAKNPTNPDNAYGLGQITNPIWKDAVKEYNSFYSHFNNRRVDESADRADIDAQVLVMGAWIEKVWAKSLRLSDKPFFYDYQQKEIAYAIWHNGNSYPDSLLVEFLDSPEYTNPHIRNYFLGTYSNSREIIGRPDISLDGEPLSTLHKSDPLGIRLKQLTQGLTIMNSGETLQRDGNKVWRITPDGKRSGYFISE